jgi:hypothetical protein
VALLRNHVDIVDVRHGMPGEDSVREIRRYRRQVRQLLSTSPPDTVVHAETSGGSSPSYWAMRGLTTRKTVAIHDAPRPYWFPTLTRGVARLRLLRAGLLRLLSPVHLAMERRFLRDVDVLTMTDAGASAVKAARLGRRVTSTRLLIPAGGPIVSPSDRPAAVGLFGHVYRGKGFEFLAEIRALLPDDVELRVAGRGTDELPVIPGVQVAGAVEGRDVAAWFATVRVILLPYRRAPIGGVGAVAASGVQALATAYDTPCLALESPSMRELATEGGCEVFPTLAALVERAATLARNADEAHDAYARVRAHRQGRQPERTVDDYLRLWGDA